MKNKVYITIASIVLILLQLTFCEYIKVCGIKPNLVLIFIVALGFYASRGELFFGGVFIGLLQDVLLSKSIGMFLMINVLFCMIIENCEKYSFNFLKVFAFSLLYDSLIVLFFHFPVTLKELAFVFCKLLVGGALYNIICFTIVFFVVKRKRKIRNL